MTHTASSKAKTQGKLKVQQTKRKDLAEPETYDKLSSLYRRYMRDSQGQTQEKEHT